MGNLELCLVTEFCTIEELGQISTLWSNLGCKSGDASGSGGFFIAEKTPRDNQLKRRLNKSGLLLGFWRKELLPYPIGFFAGHFFDVIGSCSGVSNTIDVTFHF